MDLRPQAHEIIRTWLFSSVVRSHYEHDCLPWANAAISGFIVDPDRKKLSKSAGNMPDDPFALIERHGADAVRYWAANGRPGMDMAFDEGQMKIGRRLATKLLNASRFALNLGEPSSAAAGVTDAARPRRCSRAWPRLVDDATAAFDHFDYARALERTEGFFWPFCDDYLELVKNRAYGSGTVEGRDSALVALRIAARGAAAAVRAVPAVRHRRGLVVVAAGQHPPLHLAVERRAPRRGSRRRPRGPRRPRPTCSARSARRRPRPSARCEPTSSGSSSATQPSASPLLRLVEGDVRSAGVIAALELAEAPALAVEVTLPAELAESSSASASWSRSVPSPPSASTELPGSRRTQMVRCGERHLDAGLVERSLEPAPQLAHHVELLRGLGLDDEPDRDAVGCRTSRRPTPRAPRGPCRAKPGRSTGRRRPA